MTEQLKRAKRTVTAPTNDPLRGGQVLSVELSPDEDVEWIWSHDRERGSRVTGYRIVIPAAEARSGGARDLVADAEVNCSSDQRGVR